jgi:hypothetical protein
MVLASFDIVAGIAENLVCASDAVSTVRASVEMMTMLGI